MSTPTESKIVEEEVISLDDKVVRNIILVAKNGAEFEITAEAASISKLVKTAIETDESGIEIPITVVSAEILSLIVEYMKHHNGTEEPIIEKPLRDKNLKNVCKDVWDAEFIDTVGVEKQKLYDLILAANYMDINALLHLGCAKVASIIKGEPLEKIKELLAVSESK